MDSKLLNKDNLSEILLHLSFTSLLRFRVVCKSWRDHIDSQPFRKSHIRRHADNDDDTQLVHLGFRRDGDVSKPPMFSRRHGKFYHSSPPPIPEVIGAADDAYYVQIAGPSNGVICICCRTSNAPIAVCNPSLGRINILPTCSFDPNPSLPTRSSEPSGHRTLSRAVGIFFDEVAGDYVVVKLLSCLGHVFQDNSFKGRCHMHASVYSRVTNSWRELAGVNGLGLTDPKPIKSSCKNESSAHWLATAEGVDMVILSFDFKNEGFRVLEMVNPEILSTYSGIEIFAEGGDSFLLFIYDVLALFWGRRCNWFEIRRSRIEGDRVHWDDMKGVASFDGFVTPKALCERGFVVFRYYYKRKWCLVYYDYLNEKCVEHLEIEEGDDDMIFEYKGSFVLP